MALRRTTGSGTCTIRVTFGGHIIVQFAATSDATILLHFTISRTAVGAQRGYGRQNLDTAVTGTSAVDETSAQPLQVLLDKGTGGDAFTCDQFALQLAA